MELCSPENEPELHESHKQTKSKQNFCLGKKQIATAYIKTLNVSKIIPYRVGQK